MNNVKETILRTLKESVQKLRDEHECDPEGCVEQSFLMLFSTTEINELTGINFFESNWDCQDPLVDDGWVVRVVENMSDELSQRTLDMMKVPHHDDWDVLLWKIHPSRPDEDSWTGWTDEQWRQFRMGWEWTNTECRP